MQLEQVLMKAWENIRMGDPVCFTGNGSGIERARADTLHLRNVFAVAEMDIIKGSMVSANELVFPGQVVGVLEPSPDTVPQRAFFLGSQGGLVPGIQSLKPRDYMTRVGFRVDDALLYVSIQDFGRKP